MACAEARTPTPPLGPPPAVATIPTDSLYQLDVPLETATGATVPLSTFRGSPVIVSMFYASCAAACPMLVADIQALERQLTEAERARLRVLLISLDPEHDDPAALQAAIDQYGVQTERWLLTRPPVAQVRDISAVLGIAWQAIEGGELHHSSVLTLLDPEGRPVSRLDGLRKDPSPLLSTLRALPRPPAR